MVEWVKPLAHKLSFSPLDWNFFLGQRSQENEKTGGVDNGPVSPHFWDSWSDSLSEVVLLNVEQVSSSCGQGEEGGALKNSFAIVKSVYDSLVLLPLVSLHLIILLLF